MTGRKQQLGCWLHERWRLEFVLRAPGPARRLHLEWTDLCNRQEHLLRGDENGRVCPWEDSSRLTVARVFPSAGGRLMHHCFKERPIVFSGRTLYDPVRTPDLSVILPAGGEARMAQCRTVLSALAGQTGVKVEVLVAEEGVRSVFPSDLSEKVRHVFLRRNAEDPYCKSRMINAGAAVARGRILLLHDADIAVPASYLREIVECMDAGCEGVRPIRFLFCLDQESSLRVQEERCIAGIKNVPDVMQNFPGGSVAVRRDVFEQIGGMDEQFKEWGGEDLEFLDRLNTRRIFRGAWMPGVHLWHAAADQKQSGHRNHERMKQVRALPAEQRIGQLLQSRRKGGL